ncbi:MAG: Type pilin PilA [Frankiales bacterium]|nr:Type pilin PilA [Frankiales bacterium]
MDISLVITAISRRRDDEGFTLIELLVVVVVLSALAAIAIPTYLSQTRRAFDAQMKTSLRSLATNEETFLAENDRYGSIAEVVSSGAKIALSGGVTLNLLKYDGNRGYCIQATHRNAAGSAWYWDSVSGGLQPAGATSCPDVTTGADGDSLP